MTLGEKARHWEGLSADERLAISLLVPQREPWRRVRFFNFYRAARYRGARLCWSPVRFWINWPLLWRWRSWFSWHGWELEPEHVEPHLTSWGKMPGYRERLGHCITILKVFQIAFGPAIGERR